MSEGGLTVDLEIREGAFYPEDESGPSLRVFAFAERGKQLQIPGPMIRIPQDTRIHVTVHNLIARDVLIHGMHTRPVKNDDTFEVAAGATRDVTFSAGAPALTTTGQPPAATRSEAGPSRKTASCTAPSSWIHRASVAPDRVFVIGMWRDRQLAQESFDVPVINGKSWPYTERLEYPLGSEVRWVWLNPSGNVHPMHMHGSYFQVLSAGDAEHSDPVPTVADARRFHQLYGRRRNDDHPLEARAHGPVDLSLPHPDPHIPGNFGLSSREYARRRQHTDPINHMAGLVMGITIVARNGTLVAHKPPKPERKLQLLIAKDKSNPKKYTYSVLESGQVTQTSGGPGPTLVLTRNQPVAIHIDEPARRSHIGALARNRTGELLRWCARMGRRWPASHAHDRAREIVRRAVRTATRGDVHVPHPHK